MAKLKPTAADRTRGRLLYVEFDGGNDAVMHVFQSLTAAIQASAVQTREPRALISAARSSVSHQETTASDEDQDPQQTFPFDALDGASPETIETEPLRKKRGDGERKDRNAGIKLVGDLDFVPAGKQSLKAFFAEKAPSSDMDQILVLCYFMQHTLSSPKIGPGHILSAFKHVVKPVPKDLKQTIRNMKEKKAWLGFSDMEDIRLTTEGDNRVEHELGKASGDSGAD